MIQFLNPTLLWGLAAVALPIAIHLLLRQRPVLRPWAAMTWLLAAMATAQRRYRLTNLLLLLLRCLLLALCALALARPSILGLGEGGHVVLVIDISASMGPRHDGPGALEQFRHDIAEHGLQGRDFVIFTVSDGVSAVGGPQPVGARRAEELIARLRSEDLPGGLDDATTDEHALNMIRDACQRDSTVLLISDFRQDDGGRLRAALVDHSRSLIRLVYGEPGDNVFVKGIEHMPDPTPGSPGTMRLQVAGTPSSAQLNIGDAAPLPIAIAIAGDDGMINIPIPPLPSGSHLVRVQLDDDEGLRYDDALEVPIRVRPHTTTLAVSEGRSMLATALAAASHHLDTTRIRPGALATQPLPEHGLVALRATPGQGDALLRWIDGGGVLWADHALLVDHPELAILVEAISIIDNMHAPGGSLSAKDPILNVHLRHVSLDEVQSAIIDDDAMTLLQAGDAAVVVAVRHGRGAVIVNLMDIDRFEAFWDSGASTLWVQQTARQVTAMVRQAQVLHASGTADADITFRREAVSRQIAAGQQWRLSPGRWERITADGHSNQAIILPCPDESTLGASRLATTEGDLASALGSRQGSDWGLTLLIMALVLALGEGLLAAWAGRTYGR